MSKLSAHGHEIARYFSPTRRTLVSIRADGTTHEKSIVGREWRLRRRKKPNVSLEAWRAAKLEVVAKLPAWCRSVTRLPSLSELEEWSSDSICETVTGDRVEPDGTGPDGAPSWLLALGMV